MRLKKSVKNSSVAVISFILSFIPIFFVRKVFIDILGSDLLGLSSLYTNIVGYLSIVEMGIGSAIIYSLYKPFATNNKKKIIAYLNYYKRFYKRAGIIILMIGTLITPFIHIFIKDDIPLSLVRIGFILFLVNTFLGYMFTYKHCLLNAAQEGFRVSISITSSKILIAIVQIIVLILYKNFYLYILVQIVINLFMYISLNFYINKRFYWIKEMNSELDENEKESLYKNIRALFCHKIGRIFVFGTDNIVASSFISLNIVTICNNYTLITNACAGIIEQAMNGITASIGNLLVEENSEHAYKTHQRLFFISFWLVSFIIISLFNTINQFIMLWVGSEYLLDNISLSIILINLYFQMMRGQVEQFKNASGEYYKDRFAPICEGIINLISSIVLVNLIGLPGIFLGTLVSNLSVIFWVQPKIVYKYVFKKPLKNYFERYSKYLLIAIFPLLLTLWLTHNIKQVSSIGAFLINCSINILVVNIFYLIIFWKNKDFIYFRNFLHNILRKS